MAARGLTGRELDATLNRRLFESERPSQLDANAATGSGPTWRSSSDIRDGQAVPPYRTSIEDWQRILRILERMRELGKVDEFTRQLSQHVEGEYAQAHRLFGTHPAHRRQWAKSLLHGPVPFPELAYRAALEVLPAE